MCEVVVGRANQTGSIYIGRGSVFGNPWSIESAIDEYGVSRSVARDIVCDKFEEYFHSTLKHTTEFKIAIGKIVDNSVYGESVYLDASAHLIVATVKRLKNILKKNSLRNTSFR